MNLLRELLVHGTLLWRCFFRLVFSCSCFVPIVNWLAVWLVCCYTVAHCVKITTIRTENALQHHTINIQAWRESDGLQAEMNNASRKCAHTYEQTLAWFDKTCEKYVLLQHSTQRTVQYRNHGLLFAFDQLHRWTATNLINIYQYMWDSLSMPFSRSIAYSRMIQLIRAHPFVVFAEYRSFGKITTTCMNIKIDFRKIEGEREAIYSLGGIGGKNRV